MSITSSNNRESNPAFVELLARYAGLAGWLANLLYSEEPWLAEDLWPRFLAECVNQGVSETAYPFTAGDQGLADLRTYLQSIWEKPDTLQFSQAGRDHVEQAVLRAPHEGRTQGEIPTDKIPESKPTAENQQIQNHAVTVGANKAEDLITLKAAQLPAATEHARAEKEAPASDPTSAALLVEKTADVTALETLKVPATPLLPEASAQKEAPSLAADPPEETADVTAQETGQLPAVTEKISAQKEAAHPAKKTTDVAALETLKVPVTPLMREVSAQKEAPALAANPPEEAADVTAQATGQLPVVTEETADVTAQATGQLPVVTERISAQKETPALATAAAEKARDVAGLETLKVPAMALTGEDAGNMGRASTGQRARISLLAPKSWRRHKKRPRRRYTRRQRILSLAVLAAILLIILVPALALLNFGLSAYSTYHDLNNQAHSAVNHLLDIKTIFSNSSSSSKSHLDGLLDLNRLQRAEQDFIASGRDFQQLQNKLKQSSTLQTVTTYFPQYRSALVSARAASQIGIDVAKIGQIATSHATQIAPSFSGSLLAATGGPLVTQTLLDTLNTTIDQVTPLLKDIQTYSSSLSLDSLPISVSEKTQVSQLLVALPTVIHDLGMARGMLSNAGWLLGVNQPRTFLVQTMDRAELRATGGFTGQYGELTISGGRLAPFSLKDIAQVEYTSASTTQGQLAPTLYRSWWPFANWGLRDSNVSADFPTTAQVAMTLYKQETGNQVDGVISFTPVMIEHVLAIMGPIQVPGYGTTVTAQNLEDVLHYYQLDNSGILKQILSQPNNTSTSQRKRFTSYLTTLVMDKVRSASTAQLLTIGHQMLADLKSKDLQIYFSELATENMLMQYGYASALDRSTTHDGFYVVQENLSASKASQYVQTIMHDNVTLDSKGGATHVLQVRLVYNQAGPVYGYDTYYDYLRVYVPTSATLLSGDGFSSGTPLCGGAYGNCPLNGPYPGGELACPAGQYQPGASPPTLVQPDGGTWLPLQTLSGPTNVVSDEPGRTMYGGWVIVPKNCTMNVTLAWYVPALSTQPYTLLVQRQAGTFPELDLSILPDAADCTQLKTTGLHYDSTLLKDNSFTLPSYRASQGKQNCYPRTSA
ncbi:MAG TPA: DUF4012 domain-containing protein [Ktedonobacteraceae bacterium]